MRARNGGGVRSYMRMVSLRRLDMACKGFAVTRHDAFMPKSSPLMTRNCGCAAGLWYVADGQDHSLWSLRPGEVATAATLWDTPK